MASKLHDVGGWLLISWDWHMGVHWPTPIPAVMPFHEINVAHPFIMGPDDEPTVKFNGRNAVKDQHEPKFLWPHFPVAPDPLNLVFPLDVLFGSQACWLARSQVIVKDKPAAPTVFFCELSCNNVCHSFGKIPTSLILQTGTVETTPTLADYLGGLVRMLVSLAIDVFFFLITGGGKGTNANIRMGYGKLSQQGKFFSGRYLTTARNRFARELVSRATPWKWQPGKNGHFSFSLASVAQDAAKGAWNGAVTPGNAITPGGLDLGAALTGGPGDAAWGAAKGVFPGLEVGENAVGVAQNLAGP